MEHLSDDQKEAINKMKLTKLTDDYTEKLCDAIIEQIEADNNPAVIETKDWDPWIKFKVHWK